MTTQSPSRWPLERGLFTVAGTVTLIAAALSASHSAPARHRSCCAAPAGCARRSTPTPPITASPRQLVRR